MSRPPPLHLMLPLFLETPFLDIYLPSYMNDLLKCPFSNNIIYHKRDHKVVFIDNSKCMCVNKMEQLNGAVTKLCK